MISVCGRKRELHEGILLFVDILICVDNFALYKIYEHFTAVLSFSLLFGISVEYVWRTVWPMCDGVHILATFDVSSIELSVLVGVSHSNSYMLFPLLRSVNSIFMVKTVKLCVLGSVRRGRRLKLCRGSVLRPSTVSRQYESVTCNNML